MTRGELTQSGFCGFVEGLRVRLWKPLWSSENGGWWSWCSLFSHPHSPPVLVLLVRPRSLGLDRPPPDTCLLLDDDDHVLCFESERVEISFWTQSLSLAAASSVGCFSFEVDLIFLHTRIIRELLV